MKVTCPNPDCGQEVEYEPGESEFCMYCGKPLLAEKKGDSPSSESKPEGAEPAGNIWSTIVDMIGSDACKMPALNIPPNSPIGGELSAGASFGGMSQRTREIADHLCDGEADYNGDCDIVRVEFNVAQFMLKGAATVLKLRLTLLKGNGKGVLLFLYDGKRHQEISLREELRLGRPREVRVAYSPQETGGQIALDFYVICMGKSGRETYRFTTEHKIYDPESLGAEGTHFVLNTSITGQHAATINYRVQDELHKILSRNPTYNELVERLNDMHPCYVEQTLVRSDWTPEDDFISGEFYRTQRLALECDGKRIRMLGGIDSVKMGRNAHACDVVVRFCDPRISPQAECNRTVSSVHVEILYENTRVLLFDRSTYGTFINDGKVESGTRIPLEEKARIGFGDVIWNMNIQQCQGRARHLACRLCPSGGVRALTFTCCDRETESHILVWKCCELGRIYPELSDWTVFYRNEGFFLRTPEQKFYHLRPGQAVTCGGKSVKVSYYE